MGCDWILNLEPLPGYISIHAPTWGATFPAASDALRYVISIHAPTWGATNNTKSYEDTLQFQSTHPRGVRHRRRRHLRLVGNFNPRTHVGCDRASRRPSPGSSYFNPRTHVGCDLDVDECDAVRLVYFNPRTHVGCDSACACSRLAMSLFQSTHPRGVRQY